MIYYKHSFIQQYLGSTNYALGTVLDLAELKVNMVSAFIYSLVKSRIKQVNT